jgi:pilus assembly protein CpaE
MSQQGGVDRNLRILLVGADPALEEEFRTALAGVPDTHGVVHFTDTYRHALEIARGRQPNLVVIDIDRDIADIAALSKEIHDVVPGAAVAGAYKLDRFEQGQSESAAFIELLRADVGDFLRQPVSATELRAVLERLFARSTTVAHTARGRVVAFLSNKGGVGKSTLAVNVACGLALRYPDEVLLIDASLQGGACAMMLALKATTSLVDAIHERDRLDATLLRQLTLKHPASDLRLLAAPADALEGAEVNDEAVARVLHLARRSFKYVVVDTFPALDSVVTTILDLTDVAFVVVQALAPAVAGAAKLLPVLDGLGLPPSRQRLVLNYNYRSFSGDLRASDIENLLQRTADYTVPYEKRILVSMNTGSPHILHARRWQAFRRIVTQMLDDVDGTSSVTGVVTSGVTGGVTSAVTDARGGAGASTTESVSDRDRNRASAGTGRPESAGSIKQGSMKQPSIQQRSIEQGPIQQGSVQHGSIRQG